MDAVTYGISCELLVSAIQLQAMHNCVGRALVLRLFEAQTSRVGRVPKWWGS